MSRRITSAETGRSAIVDENTMGDVTKDDDSGIVYADREPSLAYRVAEPVLAVSGLSFLIMILIHHMRSVIPGGIFDHHRRSRSHSRSRGRSRSPARGRSRSPGGADNCVYNTIARDTFSIVLAAIIYCLLKWWFSEPSSKDVDPNHRVYTPKVGEYVFGAGVTALILIVYFRAGNSIHS